MEWEPHFKKFALPISPFGGYIITWNIIELRITVALHNHKLEAILAITLLLHRSLLLDFDIMLIQQRSGVLMSFPPKFVSRCTLS